MEVYLFKLNGWPEFFSERIEHLSTAVDSLVVIRSKPLSSDSDLNALNGVTVYDLPPRRGGFVKPGWAKPFVFSVHVFLGIAVALGLMIRRRHRPDVIHAIDYALGGFAALVTARIARTPFVVSVRGLKEPAYQNMVQEEGSLSARVKYRILQALSKQIIPRADYVITKADYQKEFVKQEFEVSPGFLTVPTGVDFERFDRARSYEQRVAHLFPDAELDDDTVVLYLGKLIPRKGIDRLLELVLEYDKCLPADVRFALIGEFRDSEFESTVRELCDQAGDRVLLYPNRIPYEEVPGYLADADAVVLLSKPANEGVPRILQEACAIGTPIIAADVTGISRAFETIDGCYLVSREDGSEFVDALQAITDGEGTVAADAIHERFDIQSNYGQYRTAYDAVATE